MSGKQARKLRNLAKYYAQDKRAAQAGTSSDMIYKFLKKYHKANKGK